MKHRRSVPQRALAEIAEIASGVTKGRRLSAPGFSVPYLRVANVQAGHLRLDEIKEIEATAGELQRYRLQKGDVLMTEGGDPDKLGRGALWEGAIDPCIHQNHLFRVRLDTAVVEPSYFVRFLATPPAIAFFLGAAKQTTGIATINRTQLSALPVPLPPLPEQRRIADILDKADAIRRKRKEAIALTEELLRSAFLEMFGDPVTNPKGWPVKALGAVSDVAGGLQVTSARASNPTLMPYLRVANVYRDRLELSEVKEIRVTEAERVRATLRNGDVLIVEGHGNPEELGRSAVWRDEIAGCTHQNHLIRVRATAGVVNATFLSAFLNSSSGKKQMLALGKTTSGLNTISTNNVRSVQIALPPLKKQVEYAEVADGVATLVGAMQRRSGGDEDLFNSLVARAFSGALETTR